MLKIFRRSIKTEISKVKKGNFVLLNKKILAVTNLQQRSQARGGSHYKVELKDIKTSAKTFERVNAGQSLELIELTQQKAKFLYNDTSIHVLDNDMNELEIPLELIDSAVLPYLVPDTELVVHKYEDMMLKVDVPEKLTFEVVETGVGQASASGADKTSATKDAILENGQKISVPEFVQVGDRVVVNILKGTYYERE